jgi:hypothetical protein
MLRSADEASANHRGNILRQRVHPGSSEQKSKIKTATDFTLHFFSIIAVSFGRMWKSPFAGMILTIYITWY